MTHPIHFVRAFEIAGPYTLDVEFEDGWKQRIDSQPLLSGKLFRPLREPALFNQVGIDPEVRTLVWPNGADFDPATPHDWPDHAEALIRQSRKWDGAEV